MNMGIKASPPSLKDAFRLTDENNSFGNPAEAMVKNQKASDDKRANMAEEDAEVEQERAKRRAADKKYAKGGVVKGKTFKGYGIAKKV
jgi:hypothetical protein